MGSAQCYKLDRLPYREKIFVYQRILMKFTGSVPQPITHLLCEFDQNRTKITKMYFNLAYFNIHLYSKNFVSQRIPLMFFSGKISFVKGNKKCCKKSFFRKKSYKKNK